MKTTKVNGKIGFTLCSAVESYLEQTLGKGWRHDGMIQAVESWYNDRKITEDTVKHGSVTDRPKQGKIVGRENISRSTELVRNNVGLFVAWHDKIESASDKLTKIGAMVTVTGLPEVCTFADWINAFKANKGNKGNKPAIKPQKPAKGTGAPEVKTEPVSAVQAA